MEKEIKVIDNENERKRRNLHEGIIPVFVA